MEWFFIAGVGLVAYFLARPKALFAKRPSGVIGFSSTGLDLVRAKLRNWTVVNQVSDQSIAIAPGSGVDVVATINASSSFSDVWITANVLADPPPRNGSIIAFMPAGVIPQSDFGGIATSVDMASEGIAAGGVFVDNKKVVLILLLAEGERL